jgi:hypothetical protein
MAPKMATMDDENLALCKFYRQPPDGSKPLAYSKIAAKVKRRDGHRPSAAGVCLAACSLGWWFTKSVRARVLSQLSVLFCVCVSLCVCVCLCAAWGSHGECVEHVSKSNP